jgi:protein disulfide-isomerase A1
MSLIAHRQSLPAVTSLTAVNHEDFIKADKIVVVAYLNSPSDEPSAEFNSAAEKHRDDYLFGLSSDPAVISAARVTPPAIVIYRAFDEPRIEYPYPVISTKVEDLEEWIKDLSIPIIDEVSGENYAVYAQSQKPLAYLFVDPEEEKKQDYIEMVRPTATRYKNKVNFVWIDASKFADHAKALNLQQAKWPSFVIQELTTQLKYPYDQNLEVSEAAIADHVTNYLEGKIDPQLKSQPIPETQDEPVQVVVGKNFEDIVFDDSKDVFIEFYATWFVNPRRRSSSQLTVHRCGHCKRLAPVWDQLAARFENVQNLVM